MNVQQIKMAVDAGLTVNWVNAAYEVVKDRNGKYLIKNGSHCIGLTYADGRTLNGKESEFTLSDYEEDKYPFIVKRDGKGTYLANNAASIIDALDSLSDELHNIKLSNEPAEVADFLQEASSIDELIAIIRETIQQTGAIPNFSMKEDYKAVIHYLAEPDTFEYREIDDNDKRILLEFLKMKAEHCLTSI